MKILDFAFITGKLKNIRRTGWVREKIPNPESVAEHSFRVAILSMILAPKIGADTTKAIKMSLIHDFGEANIGDVVTNRGTLVLPNLQNKIKDERKSIVEIFSLIDGEEYVQLFDEFEENKTKTAQLVKQLDKLEMAIQALEYEQQHKIDLEEFFNNADEKIIDKDLKEIMTRISNLREIKH